MQIVDSTPEFVSRAYQRIERKLRPLGAKIKRVKA